MRRLTTVLVIIAVLLIGVVAVIVITDFGSSDVVLGTGTVITDQEEVAEMALAFVQPPFEDDYGNMRISGYVDNLGDVTIYEAALTIELRDEDDNLKETIEQVVGGIPPQSRKWFDVDGGNAVGPREAVVNIDSVELAR